MIKYLLKQINFQIYFAFYKSSVIWQNLTALIIACLIGSRSKHQNDSAEILKTRAPEYLKQERQKIKNKSAEIFELMTKELCCYI